ncbi:MAG: hypothetical protein M1834_006611 [Cirrosporium novae-zelandiae]|nr:MAG: hypothetical protein M1834_006611 [Cirrosporium novae-zelandiae]
MADTLREETGRLQGRPGLQSQHSSSLPSTPYQHPRKLSFTSRSPSPTKRNASPRSVYSESNNPLPSLRRPAAGCEFETGMANFKRRMPYSLGGDKLENAKTTPKKHLDQAEEAKVTKDMNALYDEIVPSNESDQKRVEFVAKLEKLLDKQWPGKDIKVHVFGSTGSRLATTDSDVDICITTTMKELEHVCTLAKFLAKNGMERVICVSHAKVPIVKIWDPELSVACDMNVNNTLAIENTRMIRTYVEIDDRVRPLAMIIKHWTRKRKINDAAFGGTLSSYTWICMIINFLQTRSPPILPVLQQRPHQRRMTPNGELSSFADDIESLRGFGKQNKETLGELLFQFFRRYGHEIDFEKLVISVRQGKLISKHDKGWHLLQNNRLCVEEPFSTTRNLGNTADDISFRGLHMEIRRAFDLIAAGDLDACCEEYEYPLEEERIWEKPPPQPRPVITQAAPTPRNNRNGRGGRHSNGYRGGNSNRRASSATTSGRFNSPHYNQMASPSREYFLQTQQYQLHDQLFQQYQFLQAQEQELRIQLHRQAQNHLLAQARARRREAEGDDEYANAQDDYHGRRPGTINLPPLSAPLRSTMFSPPIGYLPIGIQYFPGVNTNPPSPSLPPVESDSRRSLNRQTYSNGASGGSARAQSQPARPASGSHSGQRVSPTEQANPIYGHHLQKGNQRVAAGYGTTAQDPIHYMKGGIPVTKAVTAEDPIPKEYVGYFFGTPYGALPLHYGQMHSKLAAYGDGSNRGRQMSPAIDRKGVETFHLSMPPTPQQQSHRHQNGNSVNSANSRNTTNVTSVSKSNGTPKAHIATHYGGPLVVNGTLGAGTHTHPTLHSLENNQAAMSEGTVTSDDLFDTPSSNSDTMSQVAIETSYPDVMETPHYPHPVYDPYSQSKPVVDHLGISNGPLMDNGVLENPISLMAQENQPETRESLVFRPAPNGDIFRDEVLARAIQPEPKRSALGDQLAKLSAKTNGIPFKPVDNQSPGTKNRIGIEKLNQFRSNGSGPGPNMPNGISHKDVSNEHPAEAPKGPQHTFAKASNVLASPGGWQQTTKKRGTRQRAKSLSISNLPANGPEPLPADISKRKGG